MAIGLYYRIQDEAMECTDALGKVAKPAMLPFVTEYNKAFKTNKFMPFVLKWLSLYIKDIITRLHKEEAPKLSDTPLNHWICEWWQCRGESDVKVRWHRHSELMDGLKCLVLPLAILAHSIIHCGICLQTHPKRFKVLKEAAWGLKKPTLRDDFFVDGKGIKITDVLFYTMDSSHKQRMLAYQDIKGKGYACTSIYKLKVPLLLIGKLVSSHLWFPLSFTLRHLQDGNNYMLKEWLWWFYAVATREEILLAHYSVDIDLSLNETSLGHIPQTIVLNKYGAKSVIYHWSDLTSHRSVNGQYKAFNIYVIWGKAHVQLQKLYVDKIVEVGCWLKQGFSEREKDKILERFRIPANGRKVIALYDESFSPNIHFTEEIWLDFWEMMLELIARMPNIIGVMKPKGTEEEEFSHLTNRGYQRFSRIRKQCGDSDRIYILNPLEVEASEVIAMADINITMGVATPSTLALLYGRVGLYYDTTGNYTHPFFLRYKDKLVFGSREKLFLMVRKIIEGKYNPLNEMDEKLLEDFDMFRDEKGLGRFSEALCDAIGV